MNGTNSALVMMSIENARAMDVRVDEDSLTVDLEDGRTVAVPLGWYPRLSYGTDEERNNWELIGRGTGIHWEALDEDISIAGIILGRKSGEGPDSFARWLQARSDKSLKESAK